MTDLELFIQFKRCKKWRDPEQWELLAAAYYQRGYTLNASCCLKQAEECRSALSLEVREVVRV